MPPGEAESLPEATLHTGRRRFMRGFEGTRETGPVADFGWWESTAIPVLSRYFPELVVLMPEADPRDLELFWRLSGYAAIDELRDAWHQEQRLWQLVEDHLPVRIVRVPRADLRDAPEQVAATLRDVLGVGDEAVMTEALKFAGQRYYLPPEGRWQAYSELFEAGAGA